MNRLIAVALSFAAGLTISICADAFQEPPPAKKEKIKQVLSSSIGAVTVDLVSAKLSPFAYSSKTVSGVFVRKDPAWHLILKVRITNDGSKQITFTPWYAAYNKQTREAAASSELESLSHWRASVASWPFDGLKDVARIGSGSSVADVVVFAAPSPESQEIDIALPSANVGIPDQSFRFKIGRPFFETPEQAKEYADKKAKRDADAIAAAKQRAEQAIRDAKAAEEKAIADAKRLAEERLAATLKAEADAKLAAKIAADRTRTIGTVKIELLSASISKVKVKTITGRTAELGKEHLVINIRLTNDSPTKFVEYVSWTSGSVPLGKKLMDISDEHGNKYRSWLLSSTRPIGVLGFARIDPQKSVEDVLVFDAPVDIANELTMTLEGFHLRELASRVTFKIPRSFFEKK